MVLITLPVVTCFALVNGGLLAKLTNIDPGVFEMKFDSAHWHPPLSVDVQGLELKIQSEGNRVRVVIDSATATFKLQQMINGTIAFDDITAEGIAVAVQLPEPAEGTPEKSLPPMDDFAPPNKLPQPIWNVEITNIKRAQVRDLWVDGFHYSGDMIAEGGFALTPKEKLTLPSTKVTIDGGALEMPNGLEAKFEPSEVSVEVRRMPLDIPMQVEMLRAVDVGVKLKLHAPNLNYFNTVLLGELPDVRIMRGAGEIEITASVKGGVVANGSEIRIARRELGVQVPFFDIVGQASIDVKAHDGKAVARVSLPTFAVVSREGKGDTVAAGKNCSLVAVTNTLDLAAVRAVDVSLDLKEASAKDLAFLDRFIPAGSGVVLIGGAGDLNVEAQLSTKTQRAKGKLTLHASKIELQNRSARLSGAAEVIGLLNTFDLKRRHFDIMGSSIKLQNVNVITKRTTYKNVNLSAVAPKALFALETDHPIEATLAIGVSNLQPLMGIISANVELPDIVVGLLNIPNVAASADVDVRKKDVMLSPLAVTAPAIRVDAQMVLRENAKKEMEPQGSALVRAGPLTIGLGIDGGTVVPMLFGAPEWYAKQIDGGTR